MSRIALQAHTIRAELAADWEGTLRRVAALGYDALEMTWPLARARGLTAAGWRAWLAARLHGDWHDSGNGQSFAGWRAWLAARLHDDWPDSGSGQSFTIPALHAPLPLGGQQQPVLRLAERLGASWLVASLGEADFATPDAVQRTCDRLNAAAAVAAHHGLRLAYHNHWWEFASVQGQSPFEQMLELLDPTIDFEVDVYWVQTAGHDPAALLRRLGSRAPLLHLKDGPATRSAPMTALGQGVMDIPAVLAAAAPDSWWIVELDRCATDMLAAVQQSHTYLINSGLVTDR